VIKLCSELWTSFKILVLCKKNSFEQKKSENQIPIMKFSSKTYYVFGCFLCLNLALVTVRCDDEEEEIGSTEFGSKIEKPNTNNFKVSKKVLGKEKGGRLFEILQAYIGGITSHSLGQCFSTFFNWRHTKHQKII